MTHRIPGHRIELLLVGGRHLDRSNDPAISPFTHLVVCPNDNVGPFTSLCGKRKTIGNLFGRLDPYRNPEILFELVSNQLHGGCPVGIHPYQ